MAISLTISDGTTTVTLSGTAPVLGCTYFPGTPARTNGAWQDVTESVEVNLQGTASTIRATVNSIEWLLDLARQRQLAGMGARVYANYAPVSETAYRSEILDGRVVWTTEPGLRRLSDGTTPTVRVAVVWTRRFYWEGAEAEVSISSNGYAAATGGRVISNNPPSDWVQMAAAQVTGNLPAPVRIQLQNTDGVAHTYYRLFMSVNSYSDPANLVHYLQAEAATGVTPVVDSSCSGGNRIDINSTSPTLKWTLPTADLQRTKGRFARILARFDDTVNTFITPKILDPAGTAVLWTGDEVHVPLFNGAFWADLGVLPLPPGGYNSAWGGLTLGLTWRGNPIAGMDVIQLTMLDSYRYIEMAATSVAADEQIVHDGIEEMSYVISSSNRLPIASAFGGALMIQPNTLQRIHVLHSLAAGADLAPITNTFAVRVYYRPRRVTV